MKKIKEFFKKFFLINDTPHKIAGGAALGIFLGIVPGEGVLSTLLFSTLFRLNRLAATAGVLAVNMWSTLVILPIAATVGGFLFGISGETLINDFHQNYHLGHEFLLTKVILLNIALPLAVGFIIVAGTISLGLYFILLYLIKKEKMTLIKKSI